MKTYVITLEWNEGEYSERDFPRYHVSAYGLVSERVKEEIRYETERYSQKYHSEQVRETRRYKQTLYLQGIIKLTQE